MKNEVVEVAGPRGGSICEADEAAGAFPTTRRLSATAGDEATFLEVADEEDS